MAAKGMPLPYAYLNCITALFSRLSHNTFLVLPSQHACSAQHYFWAAADPLCSKLAAGLKDPPKLCDLTSRYAMGIYTPTPESKSMQPKSMCVSTQVAWASQAILQPSLLLIDDEIRHPVPAAHARVLQGLPTR